MMEVPEEYGGAASACCARVIVWEELARTIALPVARRRHHGPERARDPLRSKARCAKNT